MKNEKSLTDTKGKQAAEDKTPKKSSAKTEPVTIDTAPASKKARASAGRGMANEGTAVSYADESRND